MLVLGDGSVSSGVDDDAHIVTLLARLLFVLFMVGINVFMLNLMINLMDDFMCGQGEWLTPRRVSQAHRLLYTPPGKRLTTRKAMLSLLRRHASLPRLS